MSCASSFLCQTRARIAADNRPTAVYLAAKTTNYPIPMDRFREKFAKLNPDEILEHEFLVAQSLAFEFWVHGPDKALRGWALDFQVGSVGNPAMRAEPSPNPR